MRDGSIWFTGSGGLGTITGGRTQTVVDSLELEGEVRALAEDAAGSIWVARATGGAVRITRSGIVEYDARDGLGESCFGAMFETRSGELCVVGRRDLSILDGRTFTRIRPVLPAEVSGVGRSYGSALEDSLGEWWIPAGDRLYRFPRVARVGELAVTRPKAVYTTADGLAGADISKIFEDSRRDLWLNARIPGRDVVTRWDRASGRFYRYGEADGLPPYNAVNDFEEDRSGYVWLSFLEGGLARHRRGAFEWVPGAAGEGIAFSWLHLDRRGRLWIATGRDVRRVEDPSVGRPADIRIPVVRGLEDTRVSTFVEDRRGHLYMATDDGLLRWDIENDRLYRLPARGGSSAHWTLAFRDRRGVLWFAGNLGVAAFTPPETFTPAPVTLRIGAVRINGRALPIDDLGQTVVPRLTLAPNERRIEIGFFALGPSWEDDVRFQYRLEGGTSDWGVPSSACSVDYPHLASGAYTFKVRPVTANGVPLGDAATVGFHILPPVWARWWFVALAGFVLTGAAGLVHRRRVARAVELERIRTTIGQRSMEEAIAGIGSAPPDIVLTDIGLPGISGIEGIRRLKQRFPDLRIVALTVYDDDERIFEALCAGASGYLLKRTTPARLVECLGDVMSGGAPMSPEVAQRVIRLFRDFRPPVKEENHGLTPHEVRVLGLPAEGHSYKTAAQALGSSINTVAFHMKSIYAKLEVHSKSEAVAKALRHRIVR